MKGGRKPLASTLKIPQFFPHLPKIKRHLEVREVLAWKTREKIKVMLLVLLVSQCFESCQSPASTLILEKVAVMCRVSGQWHLGPFVSNHVMTGTRLQGLPHLKIAVLRVFNQ